MEDTSTNTASEPVDPPIAPEGPWTEPRATAWRNTLVLAAVISIGLAWILARVIWLWYYFGLFFFLIAGLIVGALSFRAARMARPISRKRIVKGIVLLSVLLTVAVWLWEYQYVAGTIGDAPKFAQARNKAILNDRPVDEVDAAATAEFKRRLGEGFPPGGPIGYVRWTLAGGQMKLKVDDSVETVSVSHQGAAWPIRAFAGLLLFSVGLWSNWESLRSIRPVSNVLIPGTEAPEEDQ